VCGICGIFNYRSGEPASRELLEAMTREMVHRGPDDEGHRLDGAVGLAMRRLSIIDLERGHQPIANEDRTCWVVFNGEIYNFPELRAELEGLGHEFRTRSDTETILHAYEEWGTEALRRLNGMFAVAIWDAAKRHVMLARDPFGVKPLYCYDDGTRLLFASEIKSLLADPSVQRELDEDALDLYLTFRFVPSPRTLMKHIGKLRPGHYLLYTESGSREGRYFDAVPEIREGRSEGELAEELRDLLRAAVKRQMISDVPIGALLSGGLDSTAVCTLMREESSETISTFTVGFEDEGSFNELEYARETARRLGTEHHEIVLSAADCLGFWPKAMWHLEEPVVTPSVLPMYFVSRLAGERVKVVLTGQGADEPWAGYRRYEGERLAAAYRRIPRLLREGLLGPLVEAMPRTELAKRAVRSLGETDDAARFAKVYAVFSEEQKRLLYGGGPDGPDVTEPIRAWQREVAHLDGVSQMTYVDTRLSLPDDFLLYGDKMSMAHSLEARVPMLDLELVAFAESLPSDLRLKGRTHKYLYRKAVAGLLPADVLARPKMGFETPIDAWLRQDLESYARELLFAPDSLSAAHFDVKYLERLLAGHVAGRADHRRQLFLLLSLELWQRLFLKGVPVSELEA